MNILSIDELGDDSIQRIDSPSAAAPSAAATFAIAADADVLLHDPGAAHPFAVFSIGADNIVAATLLDTAPVGWAG